MKDPAVLFYINDWLTSTSEMDADCRGWYLNLLLHNYDKGSLPNEVEKLAVLCMVKFSEYERFKQVFEQVLKQKFEELDENRISNSRTQSILKSRELFKEKRSDAGKISYLMKYFAKNHNKQYKHAKVREFVKSKFYLDIDTKNQTDIEQMFEHLFELYRNENEIEDESKDESKDGKSNKTFVSPALSDVQDYFKENGYTTESASKAFNYYASANWVDSKGNKVKNWKQKMQGVWFKPENEIKGTQSADQDHNSKMGIRIKPDGTQEHIKSGCLWIDYFKYPLRPRPTTRPDYPASYFEQELKAYNKNYTKEEIEQIYRLPKP
jgi:hypothetical protein